MRINSSRSGKKNADKTTNLIEFVAGLVDCHASFEVVNTGEGKVDGLLIGAVAADGGKEGVKVVNQGDVIVVGLNGYIRVD